jgi:hypothetical protein
MNHCETCHRALAFGATISVSGRGTYCFACYNAWLAAESGVRFDNAALEPVILRDAVGRPHAFRIHSRLALGSGHVMEAIEEGADGFGYEFKVIGPEESDAMILFRELYARMRRGLDTRYLREARLGPELVEPHVLVGRVEMDSESDGPALVVDGRPRSWEQIGRLLLSYEGWNVRFEITEAIEEAPEVPKPENPSDTRS